MGFTQYSDLEKHILTVSKEDHSFVCRNCGKSEFFYLPLLYRHARRCPDFSTFDYEERKYANKNPGYFQYHCDFCTERFSILQDFLVHKSKNHRQEYLPCSLCPLRFGNWNVLFFHMETHALLGNVDLECRLCHLHFYSIDGIRTHTSMIHSKYKNQEGNHDIFYQCCLCPMGITNDVFKFRSHVHQHGNYIQTDNPNCHELQVGTRRKVLYPGNSQCFICSKIFDFVTERREHTIKKHPSRLGIKNRRTEKCTICGLLLTKKEMNYHLRCHERKQRKKLIKAGKTQIVNVGESNVADDDF